MHKIDYKKDQVLWYQPSSSHRHNFSGHTVTVTTVGRKWVQLSDGHRVEMGQVSVDGGQYSSPGRLWPSKEACEAYRELCISWEDFSSRVSRGAPPEGLTLDQLKQARALLGF